MNESLDLATAIELVTVLSTIESCNKAISQYAEMGISGTPHDVEHREMRRAAEKRMRELQAGFS
jgi:hypothetical protein